MPLAPYSLQSLPAQPSGGRGCGAGLGAAQPAESEHKRCGGAAETISLCPAFQMGKQDPREVVMGRVKACFLVPGPLWALPAVTVLCREVRAQPTPAAVCQQTSQA